ncbi:hypothetical protein N7467_004411 [Penicillium canescens]|nr:hypothetical protein N7467_004411 [Penicillium canescens]
MTLAGLSRWFFFRGKFAYLGVLGRFLYPGNTELAGLGCSRRKIEGRKAKKLGTNFSFLFKLMKVIAFRRSGCYLQYMVGEQYLSSRYYHFLKAGSNPDIVIGLQYYHITRIVLALSNQPHVVRLYGNLRRGFEVEKYIRDHLLMVLGLSQSSLKAEYFLFTAKHYLSAWYGVFGITPIKLLYWSLKHYGEITGYVTKHLAASLGAL